MGLGFERMGRRNSFIFSSLVEVAGLVVTSIGQEAPPGHTCPQGGQWQAGFLGFEHRRLRGESVGRGRKETLGSGFQINIFSLLILHSKASTVDPIQLQALSSVKSDWQRVWEERIWGNLGKMYRNALFIVHYQIMRCSKRVSLPDTRVLLSVHSKFL